MVVLLLALIPTGAATVDRGTITVNRGAAGISLGMTRATVVAKLGKPLYQNANGFMEYSKKNLFDVYLNTATNRVRLIGISGPRFCTTRGVCMYARGGIGKLRAQYGKALQLVKSASGISYVLVGGFRGRPVFTSFDFASRGRVTQIFVGYCPPLPTRCGT